MRYDARRRTLGVADGRSELAAGVRVPLCDDAGPGVRRLAGELALRTARLGPLALEGDEVAQAESLIAGLGDERAARLLLLGVRAANAPADERDRRQRARIREVFGAIERRFREPITLRDVADELALSAAYLTDLVRNLTGKPIQQWIIERRLLEARRLLEESDVEIARIAHACGFGDAGYFSRAFRRRMGIAPEAWRRDHRDGARAPSVSVSPAGLDTALAAIAAAPDRDGVEAAAARAVVHAVPFAYAHCARRNAASGVWTTVPSEGWVAPTTFHETNEHVPAVVLGVTFVHDALATSTFEHGRRVNAACGFETVVFAPLMQDGVCVGGLGAFNRAARVLRPEQVRVAETLAGAAALRLSTLGVRAAEPAMR